MTKTILTLVAIFLLTNGTGCSPYRTDNLNRNKSEDAGPDPTLCGNGQVDLGEDCDDGDQNSDTRADACRTTCKLPDCGDDVLDSDEECDGDRLAGLDCSDFGYESGQLACVHCRIGTNYCNTCGDGVAEGDIQGYPGFEPCDGTDLRGVTCADLGFESGTVSCTTSCGLDVTLCGQEPSLCGNGVLDPGEYCDDGNHINEDICPDGPGGTCQLAVCGDGHLWWGMENCDTANDPNCHDCQSACGDGVIDGIFAEVCDDNYSCSGDCQRFCGDGIVDADLGELCDEGLYNSPYEPQMDNNPGNGYAGEGPGCMSNCQPPPCGDGVCSPGSEDGYMCTQDCGNPCPNGEAICLGDCCAAGNHPSHTSQCCANGCLQWNNYSTGVQNCGGCGVAYNCQVNEMCLNGVCGTM